MAPAPITSTTPTITAGGTSMFSYASSAGRKAMRRVEEGLDAAQDHAGAHEEYAEMKGLREREQLAGDHRHDADDHRGIFEERDQPHFAAV